MSRKHGTYKPRIKLSNGIWYAFIKSTSGMLAGPAIDYCKARNIKEGRK